MNHGILSNLQPVAYASKSLSEAEQNYANIERELLGVVFSLETFKHCTSGRQTNIITDHKPLTSLFSKCLANTSPKLARMMLRISDYDANVLYQKKVVKCFFQMHCLICHLTTRDKRNNQRSRDSTYLRMMLKQMSMKLPLTRYVSIARLILHSVSLCIIF